MRRACRDAAVWANNHLDIRHQVNATVASDSVLTHSDGEFAYGLFWEPYSTRKHPAIQVAGGMNRDARLHWWVPPERDWLCVVETLFHELVHYEQWRDGRPVNERGVVVRSHSLTRKAFAGVV